MKAKSVAFAHILSSPNRENSHSTPDYRFIEYPYQRQDWEGPHLPQAVDEKAPVSLDRRTLEVLQRG